MLGDGRPFLVELVNPRHPALVGNVHRPDLLSGTSRLALLLPWPTRCRTNLIHQLFLSVQSTDMLSHLSESIKVSSIGSVEIKNLVVAKHLRGAWDSLVKGEQEKAKTYRAVIILSRKATSDDVAIIQQAPSITVAQRTPIRVLHRYFPASVDASRILCLSNRACLFTPGELP